MANHLHELIEAINKKEERYDISLTDKKMDWVSDLTLSAASEAICFDAGNVDEVLGFKFVNSLFKLPYNPIWIETNNTCNNLYFLFGYMVMALNENDYLICGWRRVNRQWHHMMTVKLDLTKKNVPYKIIHMPTQFEGNEEGRAYTKAGIFHVGCFLSALNCINVRRVETAPDERLQKARAKRGKPPLFSYWTLELALPREEGQKANGGGTHTSPRLHLCRGHIKKRKTGYFWWQPHVRGNKDLGMVHKDYSAKYTKPEGVST